MGADFYKYAGLAASPVTYGLSKAAGADSTKAGKIALIVGGTALTGGLLGPALLGGAGAAAAAGAAGAGAGAGAGLGAGSALGTGVGAGAGGVTGVGAAGGLTTTQVAMMTAGQAMPGLLQALMQKPSYPSVGGGGGIGGGGRFQIPESLRYSLPRNVRSSSLLQR